jgi:hypothetical protein
MLTKKSLIAAAVGGLSSTFMFYLLATPITGFISVFLGGVIAVTCYARLWRQQIKLVGGLLLGFLSGVVFSVSVAGMTIIQTGVGTLEFAAAVTFLPMIFCSLSTLGGLVTTFFFSERRVEGD